MVMCSLLYFATGARRVLKLREQLTICRTSATTPPRNAEVGHYQHKFKATTLMISIRKELKSHVHAPPRKYLCCFDEIEGAVLSLQHVLGFLRPEDEVVCLTVVDEVLNWHYHGYNRHQSCPNGFVVSGEKTSTSRATSQNRGRTHTSG
jgi:hypothetical protein